MADKSERLNEHGQALFLALAKSCGGWVTTKDEAGQLLFNGGESPNSFIVGIDMTFGGIAAELPAVLWQFKHGLEVIERAKFRPNSVNEINSKLTMMFYQAAMLAEDNKD